MSIDKLSKSDLQLLSRHAKVESATADKTLQAQVYPTQQQWHTFLRYLVLGLGTTLLGAGIIFFFAYNWQDLHKFGKLGLIELVLLASVALALYNKYSDTVKNTALSLACVMLGVLFAVFGQIYQTGANAYDFFLGWTMAVALWVLVANFSPLWLFFVLLCNLTYWLYHKQVAVGYYEALPILALLLINSLFYSIFAVLNYLQKTKVYPHWLLQSIGALIISLGTYGSTIQLFDREASGAYTPIVSLIAFVALCGYSVYLKQLFYLALIGVAAIIYLLVLLFKDSDFDTGVFFMGSMFVLLTFAGLSMGLRQLQRGWNNGK